LLQEFGALHEQQVQLRELAAERIPHVADEDTAPQDDASQGPAPSPDPAELKSLAERQQVLSERLTTLAGELKSPAVTETVRAPAQMEQATRKSLKKMQTALTDLERETARTCEPLRRTSSTVWKVCWQN